MTVALLDRLTIRHKEVLTGLFVLVLVFGGFVTAEMAYRYMAGQTFGEDGGNVERADAFFIDEASGLRMPRPDASMGQISFNNIGVRGPEMAMEKPEGTLRAAFMGSSTTQDPYLPDGETWPEQVGRLWREKAGEGCRLEVFNAGVAGFQAPHLEKYWEARISKTDPDFVFVMVNDINGNLDDYVIEKGLHSGEAFTPSWLGQQSELWLKVEKNAVIIARQRNAFSERDKVQIDDPSVLTDTFQRDLGSLLETIRADGAEPVLVNYSARLRRTLPKSEQVAGAVTALLYMPYVSIPTLLDLGRAYNQAYRETAENHNVALLDVGTAIPANKRHFVDSSHFAPPGSKLMAEQVVDLMAREERIWAALDERYADCRIR